MTIMFVELKAIEEIEPKQFLTAKCSVTEHSQEIQGFLLERCVRDPITPVVHQYDRSKDFYLQKFESEETEIVGRT